jgi:8-oxo-dGTP pyrophosphatase MutT (NUDIX family)
MSQEIHAVTVFLESEGMILILLRSEQVSTYPNTWGGVSGAVDVGRTPDEQAIVEVQEETGLSREDFELIRKGQSLVIDDKSLGVRKVVHPYLFHVKDRCKIRIDWEHKQFKWIKPHEIGNFPTMLKLKETLAQVLS